MNKILRRIILRLLVLNVEFFERKKVILKNFIEFKAASLELKLKCEGSLQSFFMKIH